MHANTTHLLAKHPQVAKSKTRYSTNSISERDPPTSAMAAIVPAFWSSPSPVAAVTGPSA
jgi:hypothetical protein